MLLDRRSSIRIAGALVCFVGGPLLGWSCGRGAPAGNGASTGSSGASGTGSSTGGADASSSGNGPDSSSGSSSGGSGPGDDASSESDSGTAVTGDASTAPPAVGGVANWPQAAGPNGTWRVNAANAPTSWSVAANQNIVWRQPLPNEGQGGIAVWGDTLFLETFPPGVSIRSLDVVGHAIDKSTGK